MTRTSRPYDTLSVGDAAELRRLCTADDFYVFAHASGNLNPMHLPGVDGDGDGEAEAWAPSMWLASLISAALGNLLPGPGTMLRAISLRFLGRAQAGDELTIRVEVIAKDGDRDVRLSARVAGPGDAPLVEGEATVIAPERALSFEESDVPNLIVARHLHFDRLIEAAADLPPIAMAVIAPEEPNSMGGALLAAREGLIAPILIGNRAKMEAAARDCGADLAHHEAVEAASHADAAARAVALVHEGRAQALMKGHLHTDELLHAVLDRDRGLRDGRRRLTHVFVMDVPGLPHPLLITDAAINIAPDLACKVDIVQNAIDLGRSLGIETPRVGILSATEEVNLRIPSSVDGAILSKMAERGQITGGLVDGPLAMDNAVNLDAARTKGIKSLVAGRAEVLVAPNLDAGNMLAKELTFIAHAEGAGLVMGARVPIVLTSRADGDKARLASCAIAALHRARLAKEADGGAPAA